MLQCIHYLCDSSTLHAIHNLFFSYLFFGNVHVPSVQYTALGQFSSAEYNNEIVFNMPLSGLGRGKMFYSTLLQ